MLPVLPTVGDCGSCQLRAERVLRHRGAQEHGRDQRHRLTSDHHSPRMPAIVIAVSRSASHSFSKRSELVIRLVAGLGVEGDAHQGETVKHRYAARKNPDAPNLRQVHLLHEELFDELRAAGFALRPGDIGENVTTGGIDLLALPRGARLWLGAEAVVEVTGLRNPCRQIDTFARGLTAAALGRDAEGHIFRKAGVMAVVTRGGDVKPGDEITLELPTGSYLPLLPV
jgi:MOSC domain-containing protein YiiM